MDYPTPNSYHCLKAAIVGCGRMGLQHAKALRSLGIPIKAIADPSRLACERLIASSSSEVPPLIFSSLEHLLNDLHPDILIIASTADGHGPLALQAINTGVPFILLEKPLATSLISCSNLINASIASPVNIAVNHQMRFMPQYLIPKKLLSSKSYGHLCSIHVAAGNFGIAMNGTHYLEAFRFLTDDNPVEVSAWFDLTSSPNPRGSQFQDVSGCMRVTTSSGRRLYIDASGDQGHGVQVTYMARNGRITVDELSGAMTTLVRSVAHCEAPTSRYGMPGETDHLQIPPVELVDSTKSVMQALLAGEGYPTLDDATLAVKTLVAAFHSHRRGGAPVLLSDIADDDSEVFPWA